MNAHYRFRTITDVNSVPTLGQGLGAGRTPRRLVPLVAGVMVAVAIVSSHEVRLADSGTVKGATTVHAASAVPLIGSEEQAFIDRVRHTQVASVGGRIAIRPSNAESLIGPEEQAFINGLRTRIASVVRMPVVVSRFAPMAS